MGACGGGFVVEKGEDGGGGSLLVEEGERGGEERNLHLMVGSD